MAGGKGSGKGEAEVKKTGTYSSPIAFVYIFNLIVGAGVLALPQAFNKSGLALGTILLLVLCAMSYTSASYVIECMAAANAYEKMKKRRERVQGLTQSKKGLNYSLKKRSPSLRDDKSDTVSQSSTEESVSTIPPYCVDVSGVYDPDKKEEQVNITEVTPLMQPYSDSEILHLAPIDDDFEIDTKYELGSMATMFYPKVGVALYYICICLYLFGDLSIYAVTAPASVTRVVCNMYNYYSNNSNDSYETEDELDHSRACFPHLSKQYVYYIFLVVFILCIGPFTFFNMSKTKLMQITTTILRYLAFMLMISLAFVRIGEGHRSTPAIADFKKFPSLFGVSVYSFMCQHSLPGMVTPMSTKKYIYRIMISDFVLILIFYYLLAYTAVFAFDVNDMHQLYSLDFFDPNDPIWKLVLGIYLALFPVFTLSASFPIISVTLRENLKCLVRLIFEEPHVREHLLRRDPLEPNKSVEFPLLVNRILFPLLALAPPIIIAFSTQQIDILVSITGSFPGVGVQYVIPATMILLIQYRFKKSFGKYRNPYSTSLSHTIITCIVLVWSGVSVGMMIVDLALFPPKKSMPF